ncbi:hypothetical protein ACSSS7_002097 [Eimeria intestinalis]
MESATSASSAEALEEAKPLLQQQQQEHQETAVAPAAAPAAGDPVGAAAAEGQWKQRQGNSNEAQASTSAAAAAAAAGGATDIAATAAARAATPGSAAAEAAAEAATAAETTVTVAADAGTPGAAAATRQGARRRRGCSWASLTFGFATSVLEGGPQGPPRTLEELMAISSELPRLATPRSTQHVAEAIRSNIAAAATAAGNSGSRSSSSRGKERDLSVFRVLFRLIAPCAGPLGLLRLLEVLLSSLSPLLLEGIVASLETRPPSAAAAAAAAAAAVSEEGADVGDAAAAAAAPAGREERSLVLWWLGGWALAPHTRLLLLSLLLAAATYLQVFFGVQCGFRMRKVALRAKNALLAAIFDAALRRPHALLPCALESNDRSSSSSISKNSISSSNIGGGEAATRGVLNSSAVTAPFASQQDKAAAAAPAAAAAAAAARKAGLTDPMRLQHVPERRGDQPRGGSARGDDPLAARLPRGNSETSFKFLRSRGSLGSRSDQGGSSSSSGYPSSSSSCNSGGGGGALTRAVSFGGNLHRVVSQTLFDGAAAAVLSAAATAETAAAVAAEAVAAAAEHDAASSSGGDSYLSAVSEEEAESGENPQGSSGSSFQWAVAAAADSSSTCGGTLGADDQVSKLRHASPADVAAFATEAGENACSSRSSSSICSSSICSSSMCSSSRSSSNSEQQPFISGAPSTFIKDCSRGNLTETVGGAGEAQQHQAQKHQQQEKQKQEQLRMRRVPTQRQLSSELEESTVSAAPERQQPSTGVLAGAAVVAPPAAAADAAERDFPPQRRRNRRESPQPTCGKGSSSSSSSSSSKSSATAATGALELVNLVSVDCERTHIGICVLHELWAAPLTLGLNLLLVYRQIPGAFLYAVAVTGLCLLAQLRLGQRLRRLTHRMMSCRDARLRACRELLLHVRETKLLGLEAFAFSRLWALRVPELRYLRSRYYMHAIGNSLFVFTPLLVKVAALTCLVVRGAEGEGIARASSLFAALALIDKALQALNSFPTLMADLTAAAVALKRLGRCLAPPPSSPDNHACQQKPAGDQVWEGKDTLTAQSQACAGLTAGGATLAAAAAPTAAVAGAAAPVVDFRHAAFAWRPPRAHDKLSNGDKSATTHEMASGQRLRAPAPETGNKPGGTEEGSSSNIAFGSSNLVLSQVSLAHHQSDGAPSQERTAKETYSLRSSSFVLQDAHLQIHPGELHVVLGRSGSGKSSLLSAILGDMRLVKGEAYLNLPRPPACSSCGLSSSQLSSSGAQGPALGSAAEKATEAPVGSKEEEASWAAVADNEDAWEFVGFAPQQPIIFEGTLRSNILMGRPLIAPAYRQVIDACALDADFSSLGGDETLIDAGGHRLSGGQRARVCLARAIYSAAAVSVCCPSTLPANVAPTGAAALPAHGAAAAAASAPEAGLWQDAKLGRLAALGKRALYLLDDPFSALDAVTATVVWRRVFAPGGVLSGKTVLLVAPHAAEFVAQSSFVSGVLLVEGGTARQYASFEALQRRHEEGAIPPGACPPKSPLALSLFQEGTEESSPQETGSSTKSGPPDDKDEEGDLPSGHLGAPAVSAAASDDESGPSASDAVGAAEPPQKKAEDAAPGQWTVKVLPAATPESTRTGAVAWRVWKLYMRSAGLPVMLVLLLACAASTYCTTLCDYWLRRWTARGPPPWPELHAWVSRHSSRLEAAHDLFYLLGYWGLALLSVSSSVVTTVAFVRCGVNASCVLQANLVASLIRAPASWFDREPVGRLLNRLSDDVFAIDETLPQAMHTHILVISGLSLLSRQTRPPPPIPPSEPPTLGDLTGPCCSKRDLAALLVCASFAVAMVAKMTLLSYTVPALVLVMPVVAFVLLRTAARLRTAIRSLKRLESVARSPLHGLLAGAVSGGSTLRAFRTEGRYFGRCVDALLAYGNTSFLNTCLQAWLALRLQLIGATLQALLLAAVTLPLFFWPQRLEQVRGEMAGVLALSLYAVSPLVRLLTQTITTFVRLEVQMVSVERIRDYLLVRFEQITSIHNSLQKAREARRRRGREPNLGRKEAERRAGPTRGHLPVFLEALFYPPTENVPPEDSSYDAVTGLAWQPVKATVNKSSFSMWRWWPLSLRKQENKRLPLPLHADDDEQQPLLQHLQQQGASTCPDCAAPVAPPQREPFVRHRALPLTASGSRRSAAAEAGMIAGHETLAYVRPWWPQLPHKGMKGRPHEGPPTEGDTQLTRTPPLPPSMPFGFHTKGRIDFENVTVAYSLGSAPALRGISLTIHPGEAVGIVGRTGAGKSTLLMALTRMVPYTGSIKVDGVDIKHMPIHMLRSRLAFVPQVPTLFSGTIRWNLDPAMQKTEAELFEALRLCRLEEVVRALPQALDTPIATVDEAASLEFRVRRSRRTHGGARPLPSSPKASVRQHNSSKQQRRQQGGSRGGPALEARKEPTSPQQVSERGAPRGRSSPKAASGGGSSNSIRLSVGQKQLLCFCRALLREAPILCLDEANSAMDSSLEEEVLVPVIKSCLRRGSVLMVSHRLQHLPSLCHRVAVIGDGQLLEYGSPRSLLRDPTSRFYALCAAAKEPGFSPSNSGGPVA